MEQTMQKQTSSVSETPSESACADKGKAYYPISDLQFDIAMIVTEKSKALQAYDKYISDAKANEKLMKIFEQIKIEDKKHVEMLSEFLGRC